MSFVKAMIVIVIHVCMCRWVGGRCFEIFGAIERSWSWDEMGT